MTAADLPAVDAVAAAVHPAYPERPAVFAERLRLCPAGCLILETDGREADGRVLGYAVSHPWRAADPPALDSLLGALPARPATWYLHDVALLPAARGRGAASALVERLAALAAAAGLPSLSLVAVNRSAGFWRRHGFEAVDDPVLDAKLRSYDADARFMTRRITQASP